VVGSGRLDEINAGSCCINFYFFLFFFYCFGFLAHKEAYFLVLYFLVFHGRCVLWQMGERQSSGIYGRCSEVHLKVLSGSWMMSLFAIKRAGEFGDARRELRRMA
jgi:hypothetical protein